MKCIVLKGKTNSGKSSTLKKVFIKMLEDKDFDFLWKSRGFSNDRKAVIKDIKDNWINDKGTYVRDISGVFRYKGKTIYIVTIGDSIDDIKKQIINCLERFNNEIDLFICSRHEKNDIKQELADINVKITSVEEISKIRADSAANFRDENKDSAKEVLDKIKELIN